MNAHSLRLDPNENAAIALQMLHRFSWLRPTELGRFMYPRDKFSRKYAEKLLRKLLAMRMIIGRKLPGRNAGTAYVVATRGAVQLNTWAGTNGKYRSGKDWGNIENGLWTPPKSWQHDLWAVGVLSHLSEREKTNIIPEAELRRVNPNSKKHADGLVICPDQGISMWLEVESSRKSGRNLAQLVRAVILASRGKPVTSYNINQENPVKIGILAIPEVSRDERGYNLDHWHRFTQKLQSIGGLKSAVTIIRCKMILKGVGVSKIILEKVTLFP